MDKCNVDDGWRVDYGVLCCTAVRARASVCHVQTFDVNGQCRFSSGTFL